MSEPASTSPSPGEPEFFGAIPDISIDYKRRAAFDVWSEQGWRRLLVSCRGLARLAMAAEVPTNIVIRDLYSLDEKGRQTREKGLVRLEGWRLITMSEGLDDLDHRPEPVQPNELHEGLLLTTKGTLALYAASTLQKDGKSLLHFNYSATDSLYKVPEDVALELSPIRYPKPDSPVHLLHFILDGEQAYAYSRSAILASIAQFAQDNDLTTFS